MVLNIIMMYVWLILLTTISDSSDSCVLRKNIFVQTIFHKSLFLPLFREVVRRTTVILFTNEEDYIIAGNKGGEVYRFVEQYIQLFQILRETVRFVFLRVCFWSHAVV